MPKLGLTMTEGILAEWKIAPGDKVRVGDVIFVVETEKIANEIEAVDDGVVEALYVREGDSVEVGATVASLAGGPESEIRQDPSLRVAELSTVQQPRAAATESSSAELKHFDRQARTRIYKTPLARRMAREAGIDIDTLVGSGPRGRISAKDVAAAKAALNAHDKVPLEMPAPSQTMQPALASGRQKVVARRMVEAKRDIPHFYVFAEADVTRLIEFRAVVNQDASPAKITITHFIVTAVARALETIPEFNRTWKNDGLIAHSEINIGIAVETSNGLMAPVLRNIGGAAVDSVARQTRELVERARAGLLRREDLEGGATSVSNVGMFGATGLLPIINPGQSSILGVGRSQGVFRPDAEGRPVLRQIMNLFLSCDHRALDGAIAARYLNHIQTALETPLSLLLLTP